VNFLIQTSLNFCENQFYFISEFRDFESKRYSKSETNLFFQNTRKDRKITLLISSNFPIIKNSFI
jgi:hypothetical protein